MTFQIGISPDGNKKAFSIAKKEKELKKGKIESIKGQVIINNILGPNKDQKIVNFLTNRGVAGGGGQNYIILAKLLKVHISLILVLKVSQNGRMNETPCTLKKLRTSSSVSSS